MTVPPDSANEGRRRIQPGVAWGLGILLATAVVYSPALRAGFVWDDDTFLWSNKLVQAPDGLWRIWFSTQSLDYFPLVYSAFWVQWRLWGMNAAGYHAVNILLHGASSVLVWRILRRLAVPGAWVAGLVFAIHPVNVESVAWIAELKNALPMVFYLCSILYFLRYRDEGRQRHYWVSLAAFLAALLGKTMVVPLPFVLLLCDWWREGRVTRRRLVEVAPFFALATFLGAITVWFQYNQAMSRVPVRTDGLLGRLAVAGHAVWFYLSKALLPVRLSFVYPRWEIDPATLQAWLPLAALLVLGASLWRFRAGWARGPLFALTYFVVTLLPVLGFVDIYFMRYALVADHWQYPSLIGIVGLVCAGATGVWSRLSDRHRLPVGALAALAVAGLALLCASRATAFKDPITLWRDTLAKNPSAWMAHNNLGSAYFAQGDLESAIGHYRAAVAAKPDYDEAWYNLGLAYRRQGRTAEAGEAFSHALTIWSDDPATYFILGNYLFGRGNPSDAEAYYRRTLQLDPAFPDAHVNLAAALAVQGRFPEAAEHFRKAVARRPDDFEARKALAAALSDAGRPADAAAEYRELLRLRPADLDAKQGLKRALGRAGDRQAPVSPEGR